MGWTKHLSLQTIWSKKSIKIWYCLQFVCWSLSWELGDGVSIAKRNVVVFPPSTTYRHSLKEEKLHFLFGVIMALRSWWLICLVTFKKSSNYNIINHLKPNYFTQLSTAVAWREKKSKRFVFNKYFCLILGVLKFGEGFLRKLDFKPFHYKAMVQPVSKITTIATRNRCWM